jgi:23S rRNA pseudouridine2605 synthase
VISKLGLASRSEAAAWVRAGRVSVNGCAAVDPEQPVRMGRDMIDVDGRRLVAARRVVLMLNKPRGLVTTAHDERGRDTVYRCLDGAALPWVAPVGRLDKASEGLLLFCNDPAWAARLTDPRTGPEKTYHVQVDQLPTPGLLTALAAGAQSDGELLSVASVRCLRTGQHNAWLEIVLVEGRNRHIRRLLAVFHVRVLRLIRVAIGSLPLGELPRGAWRMLTAAEMELLPAHAPAAAGAAHGPAQS